MTEKASPTTEQINPEKIPLIANIEKKEFSLLLALRNQQKTVLEREVASFIDKSEYGNLRSTCTDMHGPITEDIDRRQRFKYSKKAFHTVMKPLLTVLDDITKDIPDFLPDDPPVTTPDECCACAACVFCGPPSVIAATLAASCTFFRYLAVDAKNSAAYKARDSHIKNLLPGIGMDIFENSKPKDLPIHQEMDEGQNSPCMR